MYQVICFYKAVAEDKRIVNKQETTRPNLAHFVSYSCRCAIPCKFGQGAWWNFKELDVFVFWFFLNTFLETHQQTMIRFYFIFIVPVRSAEQQNAIIIQPECFAMK